MGGLVFILMEEKSLFYLKDVEGGSMSNLSLKSISPSANIPAIFSI